MNDGLIREIDGDVRRERMQALWHNFGNKIIGVSLLILLSTTGYVYVENTKKMQHQEMTHYLLLGKEALNNGDTQAAIDAFETARNHSDNEITALWAGHAYMFKEEHANAVARYQQAGHHNTALTNLAQLLVHIEQGTNPVIDQNAPVDKYNFFPYTSQELAVLGALKDKNGSVAQQWLLNIESDNNAPPTMQIRTALLRQLIAIDFPAQSAPQE